jgi:MoaA/NifB/PqqE/SkfB family radical SAM enzyme
VFCYNPRHHDRRRLDGAEWRVRDRRPARAAGTLNVTLTGGEPLTHPQAFEVMAGGSLARDDLSPLHERLARHRIRARRLAERGRLAVELSLHGARPETHDRNDRDAGIVRRLWRASPPSSATPCRPILKTPLTRINERELDEMVALTEREGVPYNLDATLTLRDDGDPGPCSSP